MPAHRLRDQHPLHACGRWHNGARSAGSGRGPGGRARARAHACCTCSVPHRAGARSKMYMQQHRPGLHMQQLLASPHWRRAAASGRGCWGCARAAAPGGARGTRAGSAARRQTWRRPTPPGSPAQEGVCGGGQGRPACDARLGWQAPVPKRAVRMAGRRVQGAPVRHTARHSAVPTPGCRAHLPSPTVPCRLSLRLRRASTTPYNVSIMPRQLGHPPRWPGCGRWQAPL